jgi:hemerythrin-like domain-containing protein
MPLTIGAKLDSNFTNPIGVLEDCHRRIERFLGVLAAVAEQARERPLDEEQRRALAGALRYFREAAPRHVADEEESLFPRLRQSRSLEAAEALNRLEEDHAAVQAWHRELEKLGDHWLTSGRLARDDFERYETLVRCLKDAYGPHIALEDEEIFPSARRVLSAVELRAVGQEMAARRGMPTG